MLGKRTPIQAAALAVGLVFMLVGILGFIPGITTHYGNLSFAGHTGAKLLGVFRVNALHNLVHLGFGAVGLVAARSFADSRLYLIGGGVVYLVVFVYGVLVDMGSSDNFIAVNHADNLLHLVLGVGLLAIGVGLVWTGAQRRSLRT